MNYKNMQFINNIFKIESKDFHFWNMGTNIYNILIYFTKKYDQISDDNIKEIEVVQSEFGKRLVVEGVDVNPIESFETRFLSNSTINQYIKVLQAFDIINIENKTIIKRYDLNEIIENFFREKFYMTVHGKKIFYSIFVSYFTHNLCNGDIQTIELNTRKKSTNVDLSKIHFWCIKSGYQKFEKYIRFLGITSSEVIENLKNIFCQY